MGRGDGVLRVYSQNKKMCNEWKKLFFPLPFRYSSTVKVLIERILLVTEDREESLSRFLLGSCVVKLKQSLRLSKIFDRSYVLTLLALNTEP